MLTIGQLLRTIPIKIVYVIGVVIFETGSVICGAVSTKHTPLLVILVSSVARHPR